MYDVLVYLVIVHNLLLSYDSTDFTLIWPFGRLIEQPGGVRFLNID